jgi:Mn2+/Fe2+ NRAMP family transporter
MGLALLSGVTLTNLMKAKQRPKLGVQLNINTGLISIIPLLAIVIIIASVWSLAQAWQFSIGFFLTAIFPALFVLLIEFTSKKKFFIQESLDNPNEKRKLIALSV